MKKRSYYVILFGLTALLLSSCGKNATGGAESSEAGTEAAGEEKNTGTEGSEETMQEEKDAAGGESEDGTASGGKAGSVTGSAVIPLLVDYDYESVYSDSTYKQLISTEIPKVIVLDDQHEALQKTLDTWNQEIYDDQMAEYTEAKNDWMEIWENAGEDTYAQDLTVEGSINFFRTDEKLISLYYNEYLWLGGAHPSTFGRTLNADPLTGKILTLRDIAADYDSLYERAAEKLAEINEESGFYEGYEDTLNSIFYEENSDYGEPLFTVSADGVTVYFNMYTLAPYAAGAQQLDFPFAEYGDLFLEEYQKKQKDSAVALEEEERISIDPDGDRTEKEFYYRADRDEDGYATSFIISYDGQEYDTVTLKGTEDYISSYQSYGYVIRSEDGRYFLYLQNFGEGDQSYLQVFALTEDGPVFVGAEGLSMNGQERTELDPDSFLMSSRFDILGTYSAFKTFHTGEDGMPETEDELWTITAAYTDWKIELTSMVDLQLPVREKGTERGSGQEETVPAGSTFILMKTDGVNYVEATLPDGRICEFTLEAPEEDGWVWKLNGEDIEECFTYIPYAG